MVTGVYDLTVQAEYDNIDNQRFAQLYCTNTGGGTPLLARRIMISATPTNDVYLNLVGYVELAAGDSITCGVFSLDTGATTSNFRLALALVPGTIAT